MCENDMVAPSQGVRESEGENKSVRDEWEQEREHERWVTMRTRAR